MRQQLKRILCLFLLVFGFGFGWRVMGQTVALCNSSITVYLDSTGQAPIAVGDIDNGSTPGSIFSLNDSIFYCSDLGPQVVVLTVINGDTSSCSTAVTVEDTIRPQIECLDTLILIYGGGVLDTITITPSNVLISAWDNCDSTFLTFGLSKGTFIFSQDTICDSIKVLASDARNNKDSTYVVICFRTGCRKYSPFCADPFCWDLNLETVQLLSDGKHHIILPTTHEQNCEDKYFKLEWISPFKPLGQRTYPGCYRLNGDDEDCQEVIDQDGCPIMAYGLALTDAGCGISGRFSSTACSDSCAVNCYGDSTANISVQVNGGAPPYNYIWSPPAPNNDTLFGVPAGTYFVTVTDMLGDSIVDTIVITQPDSITITFIGTPSTCGNSNDGAINTAITGGCTPYTYIWSPGGATTPNLTGISSGTYSVTVTDANGCSKVGTYFLNSDLFADFTYSSSGLTFSFTDASNFGNVWLWDFGDGGSSTLENPNHTYATAGTYTVCLTVTDTTNGCSDSTCHPVSILLGIDGQSSIPGLSIHPNPTAEKFWLNAEIPLLGRIQMQIHDLSGRCHVSQSFSGLSGEIPIDIQSLPAGLYFVEITTASGARKTFKLVVQ